MHLFRTVKSPHLAKLFQMICSSADSLQIVCLPLHASLIVYHLRFLFPESLHSKLLPALPYVVQLLDDEDPTVRRTAVNAIYYLTETVTGRVALAHTEAFKKIYEMLFSPDKDVTLVNDGSPGQSETIRRAKKALQNMVLR